MNKETKENLKEYWRNFVIFCRESWIELKAYLHFRLDGLRLDFAIMMADAMQRARNKRFYVLENGHGKLIWLCNDDIDAMKRPRYVKKYVGGKFRTFKVRMMPKHVTHLDVMRDCFYYTPASRNNSNGISVEERNNKRERWIEFMEKFRNDRIYGKLKAKK